MITKMLQYAGLTQDGIRFQLHRAMDRRMLRDEVDHPGHGIGSRIFTGHQHGESIADDLLLGKRFPLLNYAPRAWPPGNWSGARPALNPAPIAPGSAQ